jgi:hypothetical protein
MFDLVEVGRQSQGNTIGHWRKQLAVFGQDSGPGQTGLHMECKVEADHLPVRKPSRVVA